MFETRLCVDAEARQDMWVIEAPLIWVDTVYGRIEVPIGFQTDLASIPRALRNIPFLDPNGLSRRPAVVHDWLYAWRGWTKARSDNFLRAALLAEGALSVTAASFYYAVKWFGGGAWTSDAHALSATSFSTHEALAAWVASQPGRSAAPSA